MTRIRVRALAFALLFGLVAIPARANIIQNGSFETPDVAAGTFGIFGGLPGGWYTNLGIEIQDHVAGGPCSGCGDQFVELDASQSSAMAQDFATVAGQLYSLSFAYSPRPGRSEPDNVINVYWFSYESGLQLYLGTVARDGLGLPDTSWTHHTFTFVADGPLSSVLFWDGGWDPDVVLPFLGEGRFDAAYSNSYGGYLDEVSVDAVPEPGTLALLGVGLGALAARRRRSR